MYRLVWLRSRDDQFLGVLVLPFRNADLIEIKDKFGTTPLHELTDAINALIQETTRNFEALHFLRDTFRFTQPIEVSYDEGIHPFARGWSVVMTLHMCTDISDCHGNAFCRVCFDAEE
jgi:hypothetical protein